MTQLENISQYEKQKFRNELDNLARNIYVIQFDKKMENLNKSNSQKYSLEPYWAPKESDINVLRIINNFGDNRKHKSLNELFNYYLENNNSEDVFKTAMINYSTYVMKDFLNTTLLN